MKTKQKSIRTQSRAEIRAIHKDFVQSIERETGRRITYEKPHFYNLHLDDENSENN